MTNYIKFYFYTVFFLLASLWPQMARANLSDWNFGAGLMNQSPGRYQTTVAGEKSSFNNRLALETGLVYDLYEDWSLHGDFGLLWPGGNDETFISKQVYYLNGHIGYEVASDWFLRAGAGLYFTRISGDGGTASIRNGTGFTNFPIPEETSTSRNATLNLAGEYFFDPEYSVKLETFLFNATSSRNRTYNVALTLRYHLGDYAWAD